MLDSMDGFATPTSVTKEGSTAICALPTNTPLSSSLPEPLSPGCSFPRSESITKTFQRNGPRWLPEYLEGHTSMLKGCVDKSFIHLRNITDDATRKRAYSCPPILETLVADSHCESAERSLPYIHSVYKRDAISKTERQVNILMFKPKSVGMSGATATNDTVSEIEYCDDEATKEANLGPIVTAIESSQYSDVYLEDLRKLGRRPLKDEEPVASKGSGFHELNTCKPCVFFWASKGCKNGDNCSFCHSFHTNKKKSKKMKHVRSCRRVALLAPEAVIQSHQNSPQCATTSQAIPAPTLGVTSLVSAPTGPAAPPSSPASSVEATAGSGQGPLIATAVSDVICCPVLCDVKRWKETHQVKTIPSFSSSTSLETAAGPDIEWTAVGTASTLPSSGQPSFDGRPDKQDAGAATGVNNTPSVLAMTSTTTQFGLSSLDSGISPSSTSSTTDFDNFLMKANDGTPSTRTSSLSPSLSSTSCPDSPFGGEQAAANISGSSCSDRQTAVSV